MEAILKLALELVRGTYLVVPVEGAVKLVVCKPTLSQVYAEIGCQMCDTLTLRMGGSTGAKDPIVMMVDDTGMIDNRPINSRATHLIRSVKTYEYEIHGIVVVVNDADFA